MVEDQKINPKLSERFSDLFGKDELSEEAALPRNYIEESRKLSLNKLLHLAPYSDVLLLQGQQGIGRTALLKAFIERAATTWRISYVSANTLMDGATFLRQIGKGFDLVLDDIESEDDLLWEIDRYLQAIGRGGRRAIIIIDDAHLLSDDVILLTEKILRDERTEDCVSLVLSMRQDQGSKLDRFAVLRERLSYTLTLEPLSKKEIAAYLRHRLAGSTTEADSLLSDEVISSIHQKSGGIPEEVDALAHGLLADRKSSKAASSRMKPILGGAFLVLVGIAAAAGLYYQDEINRLFELPEEQQTSTVEQIEKVIEEEADQLTSAVTQMAAVSDPEAGVGMVHLENDESLPISVPIDEVLEATVKPEDAPAIEGVELATVPDSQPSVAVAITPALAAPQAAKSEPVQLETDKKPEQAVVAAKPEPEPKPEPKKSAVKPKLPADIQWMLDQPSGNYGMQLMALSDKDKVLNFVKKWKIGDKSATFPITRRDKTLTVLIYGSYSSQAEADKAAKALPKAWGVGQPWIRRFAGIHKDYQRK